MKVAIREIVITVLLALLIFMAIRSVAHNFEVNGNSMEPTLHNGEFIIVSKAAYWFGDPHRGDIVVFNTPRLSHGVIHRIVGLPGETIEIKQGHLYVNDELWDEPYIQGSGLNYSRELVPEDCYYIIGDNRNAASKDIVPRKDIVGKAWLCYWPFDEWGFSPNHSWKSPVPSESASP